MSEPNAKRVRHDGMQLRLVEDGDTVRVGFSYTFFACGEDQCVDHGFFSAQREHALLSVEIPGKCLVAPRVHAEETEVHLACKRWVHSYQTMDRFALIWPWRYACLLLVREYPWLRPALGAFKCFGRMYLLGPALRVLDDDDEDPAKEGGSLLLKEQQQHPE
jgi:hypothetical protein